MDGKPIKTLTALRANDPSQRRDAIETIAKDQNVARRFVCELLHAATDPNESVRVAAIDALENMQCPSPDKIASIIGCMQRPADSEIVYWAATLIGRAGASASEAVPALTGALANSSFLHVREKAAWALGQIGPAATGATAVLESASQFGSPRLKRLADQALQSVQRVAA